MSDKELNEIKQKYQVLNKQYNQLLEKNQNDLVTIKQKQKSMNTLIAQLQGDKQQIRSKLSLQINILTLQLEKMKGNQNPSETNINHDQNAEEFENVKKQNTALQSLISLKQNRIEELQQGSRKLIDENIQLTADNSEKKIYYEQALIKIAEYEETIDKLRSQLNNMEKKRNSIKQYQTQTQFTIYSSEDMKQAKRLAQQQSEKVQQIQKQLQQQKEQVQKLKSSLKQSEEKMTVFKNRLRETNQQLKRYIDRDRKHTILLKKKDEELGKIHDEVEKIRKNNKSERKKHDTEQSICIKCKEWEQENKLLKQMVKSVQTMVRVRQIEAEKYKQSLSPHLNGSRQKEGIKNKKSSDYFPPLKKQ